MQSLPEFAAAPDGAYPAGDRAGAILIQADRALREIDGERHWTATRQAVRNGIDLPTDPAPVGGGNGRRSDLLRI